jgi:hypothetical protein
MITLLLDVCFQARSNTTLGALFSNLAVYSLISDAYTFIVLLLQSLDLNSNQLEWVTNHLGHTVDVHKMHYRQTSSEIERSQVAKLLLIQDLGVAGEYCNKKLEDINFAGKLD